MDLPHGLTSQDNLTQVIFLSVTQLKREYRSPRGFFQPPILLGSAEAGGVWGSCKLAGARHEQLVLVASSLFVVKFIGKVTEKSDAVIWDAKLFL